MNGPPGVDGLAQIGGWWNPIQTVSRNTVRSMRERRQSGVAGKTKQTNKEIAEEVLRSYLIRCHRIIAQDYPEIAEMSPENAADYLLHLRKTNRIIIELDTGADELIGCKITNVAGPDGSCEPLRAADAARRRDGREGR